MKRERGFSLIEMIVVVVIMGILLGLGLPSYRTYMANQRVLSTAEVFMAGLQMARGTAVGRNQRVELILTDDEPILANVSTASTSATGRNWLVRAVVAVDTSCVRTGSFIEGKSGAEGSGAATSAASPITVTGSIGAITFDGFGEPSVFVPVAGPPAQCQVSPLNLVETFRFCPPPDVVGGRCLVVRVSRGGQARLCDPAVPASDTRSCGA